MQFILCTRPSSMVSKMASVLVEVKDFVEPAGNLSPVFMVRGTYKEEREVVEVEEEKEGG